MQVDSRLHPPRQEVESRFVHPHVVLGALLILRHNDRVCVLVADYGLVKKLSHHVGCVTHAAGLGDKCANAAMFFFQTPQFFVKNFLAVEEWVESLKAFVFGADGVVVRKKIAGINQRVIALTVNPFVVCA